MHFKTNFFTKGSAFCITELYNLKDLTLQHVPVKGKVRKVEVKRLRRRNKTDILTIVYIQENVENVETHEGTI